MSKERLKALTDLSNWLGIRASQCSIGDPKHSAELSQWGRHLTDATIALEQAGIEIAAKELARTHPHGEIGIGDEVEKTFGHRWPGVVRSVFSTEAGQVRYVVEITEPAVCGALLIFKGDEIRKLKPGPGQVLTVTVMPMPPWWAKEAAAMTAHIDDEVERAMASAAVQQMYSDAVRHGQGYVQVAADGTIRHVPHDSVRSGEGE